MSTDIYLRAKRIGLDLPVYSQEQRSLKASLSVLVQAAFQPPKRVMRPTLRDISFNLDAGERLAVL